MTAITGVVRGVVQGVGFRYATRRIARRLNLSGWVRNRPDGSVEVWAQGSPAAIAEFSLFLERGPAGAAVSAVDARDTTPDPSLEGFEVRF